MKLAVEGQRRDIVGRTGACRLAFGAVLALGFAACAPSPREPGSPPAQLSAVPIPAAFVAPASASASSATTAPVPTAPPVGSASPPDSAPPEPVTIPVPHDKKVFVVPSDGGTSRVVIYLHGRCGDPLAFLAWATVSRHFGTVVSFDGDEKCDGGRTKWSADTVSLDRRITRALDAVETKLGISLDKDHRLVIGYSAGALRAEALATKFAERYPRVMLIGGPRPPRDESLKSTRAILLMAGQLDIRQPLMDAAKDLEKAGRNARFIQIPHARHGEYGPEAVETMQAAFDWVLADEAAPAAGSGIKTSRASP